MHNNPLRAIFCVLCLSMVIGGCNMKRLVIRMSYPMVGEAIDSFFEEGDTVLAQQAAPGNLKLLEGMARGDSKNPAIQLAASRLIAMYTFGYLEDSYEPGSDEEQVANQRARALYLRGRDYAIRVLQMHADFKKMMQMNLPDFRAALKVYQKKQVPELLWAAFNWGLYINLSREDLAAMAELSKVGAMAERVIELDESYYYGSAHIFMMVYHSSIPKSLGGDPDKAKAAFERAWKISAGRYLPTKYLFAKNYCVQTQDRPLFEKMLNDILEAPDDVLPEQALATAVMKIKAKRLLKMADDLFL